LPANFQVVDPGSPNDPFSVKNAPQADPVTTEAPAVPSQPASTPDLAVALAELLKRPEVSAAIESAVTERVSKAQSGLDRLNAKLKTELDKATAQAKEATKQSLRLQREVEASNLTPQEREVLLKQYAAEDRLAEVEDKAKGVDDYYRSVIALDLVNKFGLYGFTEDDIDDADSAEEIEIKALKKQAEFYTKGGKVPAKPGTPAAATAVSDLGAGGPPAQEFKLGTETGRDAMLANLRAKMAQPGRVA
jgi:hypothetical protein